MLPFIIVSCYATLMSAQSYCKVEKFPDNSAIFLEEIGDIALITGQIRIKKSVSLKDVQNDKNLIFKMKFNLHELCKLHEEKSNLCNQLKERLETKKEQIFDIMNTAMTKHQRVKRTLLYDAFHYIFGLDNEAYEHIDDLDENQEKLEEALANQKKNMILINMNNDKQLKYLQDKFNKNFNLTEIKLKQLTNNYDILQAYEVITEICQELKEKYLDILRPSPSKKVPLLSKNNVTISKYQSNTIKWIEDTLHSYADHYMFSNLVYSGQKINYLPQKAVNAWQTIDHFASVMAVRGNSYALISKESWKDCVREEADLFLCHVDGTHEIEENPSCLFKYIKNSKTNLDCHTMSVDLSQPLFKATESKNTWFYATNSSFTANVTCGSNTHSIQLSKVGIIHIKQNCCLKTQSVTLKATTFEEITVKKAKILFGKIEETRSPHLEQPIIKEAKFPAMNHQQQLKHHQHQQHQQNILTNGFFSSFTFIFVMIIVFILYKTCLAPKMNIFTIPTRN